MWIRIRCNVDPDSGSALAYIRIRIEGVDNRHERKKNSTYTKFTWKILCWFLALFDALNKKIKKNKKTFEFLVEV